MQRGRSGKRHSRNPDVLRPLHRGMPDRSHCRYAHKVLYKNIAWPWHLTPRFLK